MTNTVTAVFGVSDIKDGTPPDTLADDAELKEAIQLFAGLSPEEMKETLAELTGILGDDAEAIASLTEIMDDISKLAPEDAAKDLDELMLEEEVALAMADTMKLLQSADEDTWEKILIKKDIILESVIASGSLTQDEIDLFKGNPEAWELELKSIWSELKNEAAEL